MLMYRKSLSTWLPHPGNMPLKWLFNLHSPLPDRLTFAVCLYLLSRHLHMLTSNLALPYWPMSFLPSVGLLAKLEMQLTHSTLYLPAVIALVQIWPVKKAYVHHLQQWILTLKQVSQCSPNPVPFFTGSKLKEWVVLSNRIQSICVDRNLSWTLCCVPSYTGRKWWEYLV